MAKKTPKPPKPPKPPEPEPPVNSGKGKRGGKQSSPATPPNEATATPPSPLKPRTLVAPSSWTGKLPVTLLHEHCQKQGWNKVEYGMKNERMGFLATATLSWKNPKTNDVETVRFTPPTPEGYKPSAVEARHQCAVYALHRVASHKNLQHVLPPEQRTYWQHLEALRKQEMQSGNDYMYQPDPFVAKKLREQRLKVLEAQRLEAEAKRRADEERGAIHNDGQDKIWERSPVVEMGLQTRRMVEHVIRNRYQWSRQKMLPEVQQSIVDQLSKIGFRPSHVEEACEYTKDEEEALEWLLIYVPEDDLPPRFLPRDYSTGVSIIAPTPESLALDLAAERLARAGYPVETCRQVLIAVEGNEYLAAETLLQHLLGIEEIQDQSKAEDPGVWSDEQTPLKEIYGPRFTITSSKTCRIQITPPTGNGLPQNISIEFTKPRSYPFNLPPHLVIVSSPKLPSHVRLSLLRQAGLYALETLRGAGMVWGLADWIEENIERIVSHPGRVSDLDGVVSGELTHPDLTNFAKLKHRGGKKKDIDWIPREPPPEVQISASRQRLPAWKHRSELISVCRDCRVVVVTGETGSGKSTQVPQFILDDFVSRGLAHAVDIICTQPRRISAIGLADRVSDERDENVGTSIGYSIRGETKSGPHTKVRFVTTGVLLRRFLDDSELNGVTHVIVDEVHERTVDGDFLLLLLRDLLLKRKDLTVILMSATVEAEEYTKYFSQYSVGRVHIEGRTFPVRDVYLESILRTSGYRPPLRQLRRDRDIDYEDDKDGIRDALNILDEGILDYDLIAKTVELVHWADSGVGGILIFLPGIAEISRCINAINALSISNELHVLPLHASLPSSEQKRVFARPPPGKKKIIVSTNVAETSITIDDITAVIDTGKVKQLTYDSVTNIVCLAEQWTSRASAKQRRGRAGRVAEGTCFKLFSKRVEQRMDERTSPEIQRIPLEQLCLSVLGMGWSDVIGVLSRTLSPPKVEALQRAMTTLKDVGALEDDQLSALGRHMTAIPADLRCSKLMILGSVFGCLSTTVTIASIIAVKSPFVAPADKRDAAAEARKKFSNGSGDLLTDAKAYDEWSEMRKRSGMGATRRWCDENFLSFQTLSDISSTRATYLSSLQEAGIISSTATADISQLSKYSSSDVLVRSLVGAALFPNIARIVLPATKYEKVASGSLALDPEAKTIKFFTSTEQMSERDERVFIHPGSTLFSNTSFVDNSPFAAFFTRVQTSKVFLRDVTPVNGISLLLLCGDKIEIDHFGRGMEIHGLRVKAWARIGTLIAVLRRLLDERLKWKIEYPTLDILEDDVVQCLRRLVQT